MEYGRASVYYIILYLLKKSFICSIYPPPPPFDDDLDIEDREGKKGRASHTMSVYDLFFFFAYPFYEDFLGRRT